MLTLVQLHHAFPGRILADPFEMRAKASRLDNAANVGERLRSGLCEDCAKIASLLFPPAPRPRRTLIPSLEFIGARITLNY